MISLGPTACDAFLESDVRLLQSLLGRMSPRTHDYTFGPLPETLVEQYCTVKYPAVRITKLSRVFEASNRNAQIYMQN